MPAEKGQNAATWTPVGFNAWRVFTERVFNGDLKSGGRKRPGTEQSLQV
jgi:hypothetical protein